MSSNLQQNLKSWQDNCVEQLEQFYPVKVNGIVIGVQGTLIECKLPEACIGDLCRIAPKGRDETLAEVIGFKHDIVLLSALGALDGIESGSEVQPLYQPHRIQISDNLFGQVFDGFGHIMDKDKGSDIICCSEDDKPNTVRVIRNGAVAIQKPRLVKHLPTGIRSIDGLLSVAEGQRVGIFAGAGCGKTSLIAELARETPCDVIVFGLIGERGRELREFLDYELDEEARKRSVFVCATSDRSSMERARAAFTATAVAEGYRKAGKRVLLLIDSLTRFARAQREIGLAAGEPPGRGGFPPSVASLMPRLIERAGASKEGVITAFYTVLIEQDSMADPVADEVRSLLDGHIVLSRKLSERGHFPAVDIQASLSRIMDKITTPEHRDMANRFRQFLSDYDEVEMLIKLGEYQPGHDPATDRAVKAYPILMEFLKQRNRESSSFSETLEYLRSILDEYQ